MSSAQPDTNVPNNSQVQEQTTGEVVRFPKQENNGDHTKFPLNIEAYSYWHQDINTYSDASGRNHRETRRHYLPLPAVEDIANALGRQLTKADIDMLVGLDGEMVECYVTHRQFQPVWWVLITENLLSTIAARKAVSQEVLKASRAVKVGQFFPNPDRTKVEHFPVSGVPYYWNKTDSNLFALWSPLSKMKHINDNRWGIPSTTVQDILAERQARNQEEETVREGLGKLAEVFKNANHGDHRRDRRQFKRS